MMPWMWMTAVRRPLEFRARWLELRLLELGNLIAQIKAAPCDATRSGDAAAKAAAAAAAAASAAVTATPATPASAAVAAAAAAQVVAAAPGGGGGGGGGGERSGADVQAPLFLAQRGGVLLPSHVAAYGARTVLAAPFFAQHAAPGRLERALALKPAAPAAAAEQEGEQGQDARPASLGAAFAEDAGLEADAAAVYGALEVVEKQLADARLRLAAAFGIEVSAAPVGVRLGPYATAKLQGRRGVELCGAFVVPAGAAGARGARDGSVKRRRTASGAIDDEVLLSPTSAPRVLERPAVNIYIPQVRELPAAQLQARRAALTAWAAAVAQQGAAALKAPPADVVQALAGTEESSGDEESGDEHYARLHAPMAEEEARRLSGYAGTGAQRGRSQNKQQQQQQDGKDGGGGGGGGGSAGAPPEKRPLESRRSGSLKSAVKPPKGATPKAGAGGGDGSDGGDAGGGGQAGGTPTVVRRATAAGPGLRRSSSGTPPASLGAAPEQQPQRSSGRPVRQQQR